MDATANGEFVVGDAAIPLLNHWGLNTWVHTCAVADADASQLTIYRNGDATSTQVMGGRVGNGVREFNFLGKSESRTAFQGT